MSWSLAFNGNSVFCLCVISSLQTKALQPQLTSARNMTKLRLVVLVHSLPYYNVSNKTKCRRRDSNPQGVNHMNLNHARLPIPPLRLFRIFSFQISIFLLCLRGGCIRYSYPLKKRYSIVFFGTVPLRLFRIFSFQVSIFLLCLRGGCIRYSYPLKKRYSIVFLGTVPLRLF